MIDLEERLRTTARHATVGLDLDDPVAGTSDDPTEDTDGVVVLPSQRDTRRRSSGRVGLVAACVVATLGVVGAAVVLRDGTPPSRVDAAAPSIDTTVDPDPGPAGGVDADPARRLRDAVDATLASDSFQVRILPTIIGQGPIQGLGELGWEFPAVASASAHTAFEALVTFDNSLVLHSHVQDGAERRNTVYDRSTGRSYWQVSETAWQTAVLAEYVPLADQLDELGSRTCVLPGAAATVIRVYSGNEPCPPDSTGWTGGPGYWDVELGLDGRVAEIRPVATGVPAVDTRSVLRFEAYDSAPSVELPSLSQVSEVPAPVSVGLDETTGFAMAVYTRG